MYFDGIWATYMKSIYLLSFKKKKNPISRFGPNWLQK